MIKWVVRLAFLAGLLGVIGTFYIILHINPFTDDSKNQETAKNQEPPAKISKPGTDTVAALPPVAADTTPPAVKEIATQKQDTPLAKIDTVVAAKPKVAIEVKPTITNPAKPIANNETKQVAANNAKPPVTNAIKSKVVTDAKLITPQPAAPPVTKPATSQPIAVEHKRPTPVKKEKKEVLFNKDELILIANKLFMAKVRNKQKTDCVHLNVSADGNNRKKLVQVEKYLRHRGYNIEGREIIDQKINGFKIYPIKGCLKLVIGAF